MNKENELRDMKQSKLSKFRLGYELLPGEQPRKFKRSKLWLRIKK